MSVDDSIMETFAAEAAERLQALGDGVLAWERAPRDPAPLAGIMRELHTLKGAARMVGCEAVGQLAHEWETFCEPYRQGRAPTADTFKRLLAGVDALKAAVAAATRPPAAPASTRKRRAQGGFVRLPTSRVEQLAGLAADVTMESGRADQWIGAVRSLRHRLAVMRHRLGWLGINRALGVSRPVASLLAGYALDLERLDRELGNVVEGARISTGRLSTVAIDLYGVVGQLRLAALEAATAELPRLARDVATGQGKMVDLVVEGSEIGVDRTVLETVGTALGHLVSNAVAHGIETPSKRRAAGKPARGTVRVRAAVRGNVVTILVEDDGRGIDPHRVAERAVALGLVTASEADTLSATDRLNLIFKPGLTTSERVTSVAGRGVGLDAVQTAVVRCGGAIEVASEPGRGTTFTLRLPASSALRTLLVGRWDGRYVAVPLASVRHCRPLSAAEASTAIARGALPGGSAVLAVCTFGRSVETVERSVLVVVRCYGTDLGFVWDEMIGVEELVAQGLAETAQIPGVEAVALRPSGDLVQVVDVATAVKRHLAGGPVTRGEEI